MQKKCLTTLLEWNFFSL